MKYAVLAALLGYSKAGLAFNCAEVAGMADFDKTKFEGEWFGFGGFDDSFWTNEQCPTQKFTVNPVGFEVQKTFREYWNLFSDKYTTVDGTMALDVDTNGKGMIQWPGDEEMKEYTIAYTDYDNYAILHSCKGVMWNILSWTDLMVISRTKAVNAKKWKEIEAKVEEVGIRGTPTVFNDKVCGMSIEGDFAKEFLLSLESAPTYDESVQTEAYQTVLSNLWKTRGADTKMPTGPLNDDHLNYGGSEVKIDFATMVENSDWQELYKIRNWQEDEKEEPETATTFFDFDILTVGVSSTYRDRLAKAAAETDQTEKCCFYMFSRPAEHPNWVNLYQALTGFVRAVKKSRDGKVIAVFEGQFEEGIVKGFGRYSSIDTSDVLAFAGWFPTDRTKGLLAGYYNENYDSSATITSPAGVFTQNNYLDTTSRYTALQLNLKSAYDVPTTAYTIKDLTANDPSKQDPAI